MTDASAATATPAFGTLPARPGERDPDLLREPGSDDKAARPLTQLDLIADELAAPVDDDGLLLLVPTRPGYAVRYRTDVTYNALVTWRKRAADNSAPGKVNELRLAAIICANQAVEILRQGETLTDNGEPMTFATPEFMGVLGVGRAADAVARFYGRDGHVTAAANAILAKAGFGDELAEDDNGDPTQRTSD